MSSSLPSDKEEVGRDQPSSFSSHTKTEVEAAWKSAGPEKPNTWEKISATESKARGPHQFQHSHSFSPCVLTNVIQCLLPTASQGCKASI